jgi:hypothetical protein
MNISFSKLARLGDHNPLDIVLNDYPGPVEKNNSG